MKVLSTIFVAGVLTILPTAVLSDSKSDQVTVADEFRAGVLGFAWGSELPDVVRNFPPGIAWPLTSPSTTPRGERYFSVPDDTPVFGVTRDNQQTLFGFDQEDRLIQAIFSVPYAAKDQLRERARAIFGPSTHIQVEGVKHRQIWGPVDGIAIAIVDVSNANYPSLFVIVWRAL